MIAKNGLCVSAAIIDELKFIEMSTELLKQQLNTRSHQDANREHTQICESVVQRRLITTQSQFELVASGSKLPRERSRRSGD